MGALCTACQNLTRLVFQSERNAMFLLCLAGMITLRNHTKNLAKHIFFGAVITSLAQELLMSSWKSPKLYLNGSLMKTAVSYTYLGHIINNNLNDNKDIERQLRNFYGKSNMLRTFDSCSYAVKLQLFMSYCGSMYTAFLWCDFTQRTYRQLEVAYNNVFLGYDKYCSASSMFVENRTDGFDARIRKLVYGFRERLQISENSLIETIINSSAWHSSKTYVPSELPF